MTFRKIHLLRLLIAGGVLFAGVHFLRLQYGLTNNGQEYGTYGQYNRVLRVVREMDGYEVVNSRLSRRLDWRNLGHLDSFAVNMRDAEGRTGSIEFLRGSPEMEVRDRDALQAIIEAKFNEQAGREAPALSASD